MRIVVVGGGAAGLFAALLLARAGHQVLVLDRDPLEPAYRTGLAHRQPRSQLRQ